jgi:hypothetical protein
MRNDRHCGFHTITARDLDVEGISGVVERIRRRVANSKVYISVGIDVLDPAFAPGKAVPFPSIHTPILFLFHVTYSVFLFGMIIGRWSFESSLLTDWLFSFPRKLREHQRQEAGPRENYCPSLLAWKGSRSWAVMWSRWHPCMILRETRLL